MGSFVEFVVSVVPKDRKGVINWKKGKKRRIKKR